MMGTIDLRENYIVLSIPSEAVELEINAKVYYDGEINSVTKHMDIEEIRKGFQEAEECYIPSDTTFRLTDKGREWLDACLMEGWDE